MLWILSCSPSFTLLLPSSLHSLFLLLLLLFSSLSSFLLSLTLFLLSYIFYLLLLRIPSSEFTSGKWIHSGASAFIMSRKFRTGSGSHTCVCVCVWFPAPGCPLLTTTGLSGLIQLQDLEELELTNCPGATAELFKYYSQHLPRCMVIE